VTKAKGSPVRLAIPPGRYDGVLRRGGRAWECAITLGQNQTAQLDTAGCAPIADEAAQTKGAVRYELDEAWSVELAGGFAVTDRDDGYVRQLDAFGYGPEQSFLDMGSSFRWSLGASWNVLRNVALLARARLVDSRAFQVDSEKRFSMSTYAIGLGGRAALPLGGPTLKGYGQLEAGPAIGTTAFFDGHGEPPVDESETYGGFYGAATAGLQFMPWGAAGLYFETSYAYAPVVSNRIGETHDSGGLTAFFGLRAITRSGP
jgi:hypothetical protein